VPGGTGATVGGTGATVGGAVVVPVVGADVPVDGVGVVVDSTGWVVVAVGFGVLAGVALVVGFLVTVVDSIRDDAACLVAVRRGSASVTNNDFTDGVGDGLGRGDGLLGFGSRSRPGSGRTALDRTGPPARLTAIRPP
jgi:hypothetical protein